MPPKMKVGCQSCSCFKGGTLKSSLVYVFGREGIEHP